MLTLGSITRDACYVSHIRNQLDLLGETAGDLRAHDECVSRRVDWFLSRVIATSPCYRSEPYRALRTQATPMAALEQLPMLEKAGLRALADAVRRDPACPEPNHLYWAEPEPDFDGNIYPEPEAGPQRLWWGDTSGSTGEPLTMVFDRHYFISCFANWLHFLDQNGLEPRPYELFHLHVVGGRHRKSRPCELLQPVAGYSLYRRVNIERSRWKSVAELVESTTEESPGVLSGTPTRLEQFRELLDEQPPAKDFAPRIVTATAETLHPIARDRFQRAFRAPVFDQYGLTEVGGVVARECRAHAGYHVLSPDYLVEVVDADGKRLPDGSDGEILVTNLYSRIVPIVRYRTGDFGVLTRTPCACGLATPRIVRLTGRTITRFRLPDARTISPFDEFGPLIWKLPVEQFQMVQEAPREVAFYYKAEAPIDDLPKAKALRKKVTELFGKGVTYRLVRVADFPRDGKFESWLRQSVD